jgi:hypothetical protein
MGATSRRQLRFVSCHAKRVAPATRKLPLRSPNRFRQEVLRSEPAATSCLSLTSNCNSCRNYMPYRYSWGNSCRSSCRRADLRQTLLRK